MISKALRFLHGLFTPVQGFVYLCRNPYLWRHALIPLILNLVVTTLSFLLFVSLVVFSLPYVDSFFSRTVLGVVAEVLAVIVLFVFSLGMAGVAWLLSRALLLSIFGGRLVIEVERSLGTPDEEFQELPWMAQSYDALRDTVLLLCLNGLFVLLNLIPIVGTVIALCGAIYFDGLILGRDYLDAPLALRGKRREEKWLWLRANKLETLGLGTAVVLFALVPILGALVMTASSAGAVLLYHRLSVPKQSSSEVRQ